MSPPCRLLLWPCLALWLAACSPTYNWRELRDDAIPLKAVIPCKPERAQRQVPLGGANQVLHMHSCEAGGQTFAIAWIRLPAETSAGDMLAAWRLATLATLRIAADRATDPSLEWTVRVPGADPVRGLDAVGQGPDGKPVRVQAAYFGHEGRVYQVAVYGRAIPPEVAASYFEPLRLP